jgi:hypothetical protein
VSAPTLADVLTRHAKIDVAKRERDDYEQRTKAEGRVGGERSSYQRWLETAEWEAKAVALQFVLHNREALARMELEQRVRTYWGVPSTHPVHVLTDQGDVRRVPRSVQGRILEVGKDWKPEVNS